MRGVSAWVARAAWAIGLFVLVLAMLAWRVAAAGQVAMKHSDRAFDRGELIEAISHAERAALSYVPGATHVRSAHERLIAVARGAEATGDARMAERAWRALRGALLETRHVAQPHADRLQLANVNLARIGTLGRDAAARERALGQLTAHDPPLARWIGVLFLGLVAVVAGFAAFVVRALPARGSVAWASVPLPLLVVLAGLGLWSLALLRA